MLHPLIKHIRAAHAMLHGFEPALEAPSHIRGSGYPGVIPNPAGTAGGLTTGCLGPADQQGVAILIG